MNGHEKYSMIKINIVQNNNKIILKIKKKHLYRKKQHNSTKKYK